MATVNYENKFYLLEDGENVLACLERHNIDYPSSCKSGVCQSCLAQLTSGNIQENWQTGLKETYKAKNYFLPCIAKPTQDIAIKQPGLDETSFPAAINEIIKLSYNVVAVRLTINDLASWIPGQYLNLINENGLIRSYSIANLPIEDGFIELHMKLYPQGLMSNWLKHHAKLNAQVQLRGPIGECFYHNPDKKSFNMILAGTGTGLAPLLGIIRSALKQNHSGNITLLHGGCIDTDLYYQEFLRTLAKNHKNFSYLCCVLKSNGNAIEADISDELKKLLATPENCKAYICGPEVTSKKLKTTAFLAGIASKDIFSDSFII